VVRGHASGRPGVLADALNGQTGLRILDAGCGTGGTTLSCDVSATSWASISSGRRSSQPWSGLSSLARASIEQLPFGNASFDVATSFEVVYTLGWRATWRR